GVTQNFQMVLSLETPVTDRNTRVLGSAHQLEPIKAMSLSMCKPVLKEEDMVHGRGKRKYTKSQATRSPFMSRVTDINATESKEEKRVKKVLLNKMGIYQSKKSFCNYLARLNPNKAAAVLRVEVIREDFDWQTDKRLNDCGVFLMCHMEAYMGTIISKWAWGLKTEGRKQNTLLGRLRKRYVTTLLLSKCNMHSDSVRAQLDDIEVDDVPVKNETSYAWQVTENVHIKTVYVSFI
nr:ulp1 protease family, C-terminal catalytic domain-containing protein [Tanacetum cinerariifolium]